MMGSKQIFLFLALGLLAASDAWATRAQSIPASSEVLFLSSVVNGELTGLSLLSSERFSQIDKLADKFIRFRKGQLSSSEKEAWIQTCENDSTRHLLCRDRSLQDVLEEGEPNLESDRRARVLTSNIDRVFRAVGESKLEDLSSVSEAEMSEAIKRVKSIEQWSSLAEILSQKSGCKGFPLQALMAMKGEEYFPESSARMLTLKMYEQAAACDPKSTWALRSQYRLALLLIAEGQWSKAEKWLDRLTQDKSSDFYSRSLYWKARSAASRGDPLAFEQAKSTLTREFPIHYHSLLLSGKKTFNSALSLQMPEPIIQFESRSLGAQWNERVRAIEILQNKKAQEYTKILFDSLERMTSQAEPEARLYLAVLYVRSVNAIGAFRTLSSLIRDHPSILSRQTLSLLFPLTKENRHLLYTYSGRGLDPYLIAALIRQESGFISSARSPAGAMGLMQLMPATAQKLERISKRELFDGRTNVRLGVRYFRELLTRFSGKVDLALAAYNAGPERVVAWQKRYQVVDPVLLVDLIPFRETREYVSLISRNYYWYLQLYARHIFDQRFEEAVQLSKSQRGPSSVDVVNPKTPGSDQSLKLEFSLFSAH